MISATAVPVGSPSTSVGEGGFLPVGDAAGSEAPALVVAAPVLVPTSITFLVSIPACKRDGGAEALVCR